MWVGIGRDIQEGIRVLSGGIAVINVTIRFEVRWK